MELRVDLEQRTAQRGGREPQVSLTGLEARLLAHLARVAPSVATHDELLREVWQVRETTRTQAIFQAIRRLRVKVEREPSHPELILSESGVGYRLAIPPGMQGSRGLPRERDAFFGREAEVTQVHTWWTEGNRLVTITGFGGIGKTRLAIRATRSRQEQRAWFVDLGSARTLGDVLQLTARALSAPLPATGSEPMDHLAAVLGSDLVVLDNAEHVLDAVQTTVDRWLEIGDATFLVTSRRPLDLTGERILRLGPLGPAAARDLWLARVPWAPLAGHDDDDRYLTDILERLEGIPLAVELAAARRAHLTSREVWSSLGRSERPRAGQQEHRQGTLTRCIAWSWALLSPWERTTLVQCAVLRGGFTQQEADAIVDLPPRAPSLAGVLGSLVDQSLLQADTNGRTTRYRMYDQLADYALSRDEQSTPTVEPPRAESLVELDDEPREGCARTPP